VRHYQILGALQIPSLADEVTSYLYFEHTSPSRPSKTVHVGPETSQRNHIFLYRAELLLSGFCQQLERKTEVVLIHLRATMVLNTGEQIAEQINGFEVKRHGANSVRDMIGISHG
jgi:hypothetical protein